MSGYITKKKDMRFQSVEALQQVVNLSLIHISEPTRH